MLEQQDSRMEKAKMNLNPYLMLHTTNSKLITNLNAKVKAIKHLEDITGKHLKKRIANKRRIIQKSTHCMIPFIKNPKIGKTHP